MLDIFPEHSPLQDARERPPALTPPGLYVRGDESIRVTSFNSAAGVELAIEGLQFIAGRGPQAFALRHVPLTTRAAAQSLINLAEGWLTHVSVRASAGTPRRGACYVVVELVRGDSVTNASPLGVLVQGYVTDTYRRGYPGSPIELSTEGPGLLRSIAGTDPALGIEIAETVPTNARWRLLGVRFTLTTDATVANRLPVLTIDDGATAYFTMPAFAVQAASLGVTYQAAAFGFSLAVSGQQCLALPSVDLILQGGHRIRTVTTAIVAGDNYSAPQLYVEEWIED